MDAVLSYWGGISLLTGHGIWFSCSSTCWSIASRDFSCQHICNSIKILVRTSLEQFEQQKTWCWEENFGAHIIFGIFRVLLFKTVFALYGLFANILSTWCTYKVLGLWVIMMTLLLDNFVIFSLLHFYRDPASWPTYVHLFVAMVHVADFSV